MEKYSLPDQSSKKEFSSPAPIELTLEQAKQIAGGLAAAVTLINGHCCTTCGLGGPYQLT